MKTLFTLILSFSMLISTGTMAQSSTLKKISKSKLRNHFSQSKALSGTDYSFSLTTTTYSDLTGATSINNSDVWDDPEYVIPTGFTFQLYNKTLDSLYFGIGVGGLLSDYWDDIIDPEYIIAPFEADLIDRGDISGITASPISYLLTGTTPDRILKVEWKNAGFFNEGDSLGTLNDYINFQVWFYEGSNNIEFHYGPSQLSNPSLDYDNETGAIIGLSDYNVLNSYILTGPVANPVVLHDSVDFVNGTPANGTVYKFTKLTSGISEQEINFTNVNIFPNPATNQVVVKFEIPMNGKIQIQSIDGKILKTKKVIGESRIQINTGTIPNGLYLLRYISENGVMGFSKKLSVLK